jgi:hypothetical protein
MHSAQKIKTMLSLCPWRAQTILLVGQLEAGGRPGDFFSARWHCSFVVALFSVHGRILSCLSPLLRQLLQKCLYLSEKWGSKGKKK